MAMARFLNRLRPARQYPPLIGPSEPLCIVGDIHGRSDLLDKLVRQLCNLPSVATMRVVLVGDFIDRGPDSAGVLERLRDWMIRPAPFAKVHCLMGNHERMMLDFLENPALHGPQWLANGGDATLQSFGLSPYHRSGSARGRPLSDAPAPLSAEMRLTALRDALQQVMPTGLQGWLEARPTLWQEGPLVIAHAGLDPSSPIARQTAQNLLWGHPDFLTRQRADGVWVGHGHTITATAKADQGRISVDTGAYRTGCLTAAVLEADQVQFISTL